MPTWTSAAAFLSDVEKAKREIERDEALAITKEMAERHAAISVEESQRDLGGDSRFSGWVGRDLADLQIKQKRGGGSPGHWVFPTRKSGGPWKVVEKGRNQGDVRGRGGVEIFIGPSIDRKSGETFRTKKGNVRLTSYRRSGRWNGYTSGKGTASRAIARIEREAPDIAERGLVKGLRKRFDVS